MISTSRVIIPHKTVEFKKKKIVLKFLFIKVIHSIYLILVQYVPALLLMYYNTQTCKATHNTRNNIIKCVKRLKWLNRVKLKGILSCLRHWVQKPPTHLHSGLNFNKSLINSHFANLLQHTNTNNVINIMQEIGFHTSFGDHFYSKDERGSEVWYRVEFIRKL